MQITSESEVKQLNREIDSNVHVHRAATTTTGVSAPNQNLVAVTSVMLRAAERAVGAV